MTSWPGSGVASALRGGRGSQHRQCGDRHAGLDVASALRGGRGSQQNYGGSVTELAHVASALRGGRGSQRLAVDHRDPVRQGGVRPPGRTRIATPWSAGRAAWSGSGVRPPGRTRIATARPRAARRSRRGGVRPPGRTRIATPRTTWNAPMTRAVASALRGGRGSQLWRPRPGRLRRLGGVRPPGRTRIATTCGPAGGSHWPSWRPPSGADEDRNVVPNSSTPTAGGVASALRGGRGSQPDRPQRPHRRLDRWRPPSGADEDRNLVGVPDVDAVHGGVRPPGRTRIATRLNAEQRRKVCGGVRPPGRTRIATR